MQFVRENNNAWLLFYGRFTQLPPATGLRTVRQSSVRSPTSFFLRKELIVNFLKRKMFPEYFN